MTSNTSPPTTRPQWSHCGQEAKAADPVGCRGVRVHGHAVCLYHLSPGATSTYLSSVRPGDAIDHRGTLFTEPCLKELLEALRDPATGHSHLRDAKFSEARFIGDANFTKSRFTGATLFAKSRFTGAALFASAEFAGLARFSESRSRASPASPGPSSPETPVSTGRILPTQPISTRRRSEDRPDSGRCALKRLICPRLCSPRHSLSKRRPRACCAIGLDGTPPRPCACALPI